MLDAIGKSGGTITGIEFSSGDTLVLDSIDSCGGIAECEEILRAAYENNVRVEIVGDKIRMKDTDGSVVNALSSAETLCQQRVEQARRDAREQTRSEVREQALEQARDEVSDELRQQIRDELREAVKEEVREEMEAKQTLSRVESQPDADGAETGDTGVAPGEGRPHGGRPPAGYQVEDGVLVADNFEEVRETLVRADLPTDDPDGMSISAASRQLGISRRTVSRALDERRELYALD